MKRTLAVLVLFTALANHACRAQSTDEDSVQAPIDTSFRMLSCGTWVIAGKTIPMGRATTSVLRSLDGTMPGLQMTNGGGQPGASPEMMIRGMGSLDGANAPLIVLNGAPYFGSISSLNMQEIESISVLRDAVATFPYGSQGGNGVIQIETKKGYGSTGGKFSVDARFGLVTRGIQDYNFIADEKQYYEVMNLAMGKPKTPSSVVNKLGGYNPFNVPDDEIFTSDGKINPAASLKYHDSWSKELQRVGSKHDYNLSYQNSGNRGSFYFGAGYLDETGYIETTSFERFNASFNGVLKIRRWLRAGINTNITYGEQHFVEMDDENNNPFAVMRNMPPIYPVYYYDKSGNKVIDPSTGTQKYDWGSDVAAPDISMGSRIFGAKSNLVYILQTGKRYNKTVNAVVQPFVEATFLKRFVFRTSLQYNNINNYQFIRYNPLVGDGGSRDVTAGGNTHNFDQTLSWQPNWGGHHMNVTASHQAFGLNANTRTELTSITGVPKSSESTRDNLAFENYRASISYDYKCKYFLFGGLGRDASSMLAPQNRWNNYWSAGLGYAINEERFMSDINWINMLKLRASYGLQSASSLAPYYYAYQTIDYSYVPPANNPMLAPDQNLQWNAGVDLRMFNHRIVVSLDAYSRTGNSSFLSPYLQAAGIFDHDRDMRVRNSGLELALSGDIIRTATTTWTTKLNLTRNVNKITAMPAPLPELEYEGTVLKVGNSLYDMYLPEYAGVDPGNGLALYYRNDGQGNRVTTSDYGSLTKKDFVNIGSAFPACYGSLTNTVSWHQFDFSMQLNFGLGGKYYDEIYQRLMGNGVSTTNWHEDILNAWKPDNTNTNIPRVSDKDVYVNAQSTRFVKDASYLAVKMLYLCYNFPAPAIRNGQFRELSLYLVADNFLMVTGRRGMDPQARFAGVSGNVYAPARTIMLGLHVGL